MTFTCSFTSFWVQIIRLITFFVIKTWKEENTADSWPYYEYCNIVLSIKIVSKQGKSVRAASQSYREELEFEPLGCTSIHCQWAYSKDI